MSTVIRSQISKSNPYFIPKERYLELRHFCLQYESWMRAYVSLASPSSPAFDRVPASKYGNSDPTQKAAIARLYFSRLIEMVNQAANATDPVMAPYIIEGITNGFSYETLNARHTVPCGKQLYYIYCRKFFWILDSLRD